MTCFNPFAQSWAFVPMFDVLRDAGLSLPLLYAYGVLARHRGSAQGGQCYAGVALLSRELRLSERDTRKRMAELERHGLVARIARPGTTNLYELLDPSEFLKRSAAGVDDTGAHNPGAPGGQLTGTTGVTRPGNKITQISTKRGSLGFRPSKPRTQTEYRVASSTHSVLEAKLTEAEKAGDAKAQREARQQLMAIRMRGGHGA